MTGGSKPLARSPLHAWHAEHGAHFAERMGRLLPSRYGDVQAEAAAARQSAGLADISPFSKLQFHDPVLEQLVAGLSGDGSVGTPRGVMALRGDAPSLACRLTKRSLLILASTIRGAGVAERLPARIISLTSDVTMALAGFISVGPAVETALRSLTAFDISAKSLPPGTCAETKLADVHALLIRPPKSPLSELRIYIASDVGEYVWETLLAAGREIGIAPIGLESLAALGFPACL